MKVTAIKARNVKGLRNLKIEPGDRTLIVIGGPNGAGKSSALDCIEYALRGAKALPDRPLRDGEKRGGFEIELAADEERGLPALRITGTLRDGKPPAIKLERADGLKQSKPQTLLDTLYCQATFDPQWYAGLKSAEQAATLQQLVGLDFTELNAKRAKLYEERTATNRDAKAIRAKLDAAPHYPDAPADSVSVANLMEVLGRARAHNEENAKKRRECEEAEKEVGAWNAAITVAQQAVVKAQQALLLAENEYKHELAGRDQALKDYAKLQEEVAKLCDEQTATLEKQIAGAEEVNRKVRANCDRADLEADLDQLTEYAEAMTEEIAHIDADKAAQLENADWPIPGLGFDEDGVTYDGRPLKQASSAEIHRVCAAIGVGLSPTAPVLLLREASLLDDASLAAVVEVAKGAGGQVWAEIVTNEADDCDVLIVDGAIKQEGKIDEHDD